MDPAERAKTESQAVADQLRSEFEGANKQLSADAIKIAHLESRLVAASDNEARLQKKIVQQTMLLEQARRGSRSVHQASEVLTITTDRVSDQSEANINMIGAKAFEEVVRPSLQAEERITRSSSHEMRSFNHVEQIVNKSIPVAPAPDGATTSSGVSETEKIALAEIKPPAPLNKQTADENRGERTSKPTAHGTEAQVQEESAPADISPRSVRMQGWELMGRGSILPNTDLEKTVF